MSLPTTSVAKRHFISVDLGFKRQQMRLKNPLYVGNRHIGMANCRIPRPVSEGVLNECGIFSGRIYKIDFEGFLGTIFKLTSS